MESAVVWFRRDLRTPDHPAILEASRRASRGLALFVLDDALLRHSGAARKADGDPFKVFTPFSRAWASHGWPSPAATDASTLDWLDPGWGSVEIPDAPDVDLPPAGEKAAITA
jgi:deoxyribodipyrimidine photo-lyase